MKKSEEKNLPRSAINLRQLLGLTPVKTYDPNREVPILFEAGDYIRFVPVSESDFANIKNEVDNGTYTCTIHQKEV